MVLNRCPTKDRLLNWGLQTDALCVLCRAYDESKDHLFFQCCYSKDLWDRVAHKCDLTSSSSWETTLQSLRCSPGTRLQKKLRLLSWQATIYLIWSERNSRIHRNHFKSHTALFRELDHLIRIRIASFRFNDPAQSSDLLSLWFLRS
ncbi:uncharacterized protein LOC108858426 [Raphanus sativus]|uniref:Uncharacterized protein LOC108858426 n=1 Tax=Raphanus sativus TaxID=3726 RepID=A0A6J0NTT1_RAPSA|nr:uncharacterized protein LOC108858426 [Raphanus sativus]